MFFAWGMVRGKARGKARGKVRGKVYFFVFVGQIVFVCLWDKVFFVCVCPGVG